MIWDHLRAVVPLTDTTAKVKTKYRVTQTSWNFCCLLFSIWPLDSTNFKVSIGVWWISMVSSKITSFCDRGWGVTNYLFLCLILSLSFKWQMILVSPGRVQTWRNGGNSTILWIFWDKIKHYHKQSVSFVWVQKIFIYSNVGRSTFVYVIPKTSKHMYMS